MAIDRKAIRHALRDALADRMTADGDPREFLLKDIIPTNEMARFPLLVVEAADETPEHEDHALPPVWHLSFDVAIYVRPDARATDPDVLLDDLLGHLEAALERPSTEKGGGWWTTLGGKVVRACPSGQAQRYASGEAYWVVVPVEVVVSRSKAGMPA